MRGACDRECGVSEWEPWSECSAICGDFGMMSRTRRVLSTPIGETASCPDLIEWRECNRHPCSELNQRRDHIIVADLDCVLSEWSDWTSCTLDCGNGNDGTQTRIRQILKHPAPGGEQCPGNLEEVRPCVDIQPCRKFKICMMIIVMMQPLTVCWVNGANGLSVMLSVEWEKQLVFEKWWNNR